MNRRNLILPGFVSLGYIPLLILLISTAYFRGKRFKLDDSSSHKEKAQWNTEIFLVFFPQFAICVLYLAYPILMFIYKNTWTNTILHILMIVMSVLSGAALANVLLVFSYSSHFGEVKAIVTGLSFLLFVQFVTYSIWPFFAKMKLKTLSQNTNLERMYIFKVKHLVLIIIAATVMALIGLLCFTGALITDTVVSRYFLKESQKNHSVMFEYSVRYLMILLFPAMVSLVGIFIVYNKKFSWIVYFVAPITWIVNMLLGFATCLSIFFVTVYSFYINDHSDWDSFDKKFWGASIAETVGGMVTIFGVSAIMWAWSQLMWTYEVQNIQSNNNISVQDGNEPLVNANTGDGDDDKLLQ